MTTTQDNIKGYAIFATDQLGQTTSFMYLAEADSEEEAMRQFEDDVRILPEYDGDLEAAMEEHAFYPVPQSQWNDWMNSPGPHDHPPLDTLRG